MSDKKFGDLRLSAKGTNNGHGFDIFYNFKESHDFIEFKAKKEFFFIQPWMQFPSDAYTDECMLVSIELVRRFNDFERLEQIIKNLEEENRLVKKQSLRDNAIFADYQQKLSDSAILVNAAINTVQAFGMGEFDIRMKDLEEAVHPFRNTTSVANKEKLPDTSPRIGKLERALRRACVLARTCDGARDQSWSNEMASLACVAETEKVCDAPKGGIHLKGCSCEDNCEDCIDAGAGMTGQSRMCAKHTPKGSGS